MARRDCRNVARIAAEIRRKELELRAMEYGLAGQTNKEKIIKMIIDRE